MAKAARFARMSDAPTLEPLDETTFETVLCVAAHPDDLEYGTAAAVDKWVRAGKTVTYLLVTRGEAGIDTMPPEQAGPRARAGGARRRRAASGSTSSSSSTASPTASSSTACRCAARSHARSGSDVPTCS